MMILFGQSYRPEKRIYLLDVTASMVGKGVVDTPNIFNDVKEKLIETLRDIQSEDTEIVVIPFTNKPHSIIQGYSYDEQMLTDKIRSIDIRPGDTNIADAWIEGLRQIDSTKINYLFLLTDGLHNCGPDNETLYSRLMDWSDFSSDRYYFAFYVMLTPNAREMKVTDIVEQTGKMWLIESMNVNVSFVNTNLFLSANINQNNLVRIHFTSNNISVLRKMPFQIEMDENPYYRIISQKFDFVRSELLFELEELKPRLDIPLETDLRLRIRYDKEQFPLVFFTPEEISFHIINKGVREMTITEL